MTDFKILPTSTYSLLDWPNVGRFWNFFFWKWSKMNAESRYVHHFATGQSVFNSLAFKGYPITLKYPQIHSKTLEYTQNIHIQCIWVYVSVCECYECIWVYVSVSVCIYLHTYTNFHIHSNQYTNTHIHWNTLTLTYTQIHSNTVTYTQIHPNTLKYIQIRSNTLIKFTGNKIK